MFFSSWLAGRPSTTTLTSSATGLFYTSENVISHIQDIEDETNDEAPSVSVVLSHSVRQSVEMLCDAEGRFAPALAVVDEEGSVYIWWPYGKEMNHEEVPLLQRADEAMKAGRLTRLPLPQLAPAARIMATHQNIIVVQHQLKVRSCCIALTVYFNAFWHLCNSSSVLCVSFLRRFGQRRHCTPECT
jgi:hypothetical protein